MKRNLLTHSTVQTFSFALFCENVTVFTVLVSQHEFTYFNSGNRTPDKRYLIYISDSTIFAIPTNILSDTHSL